MFVKFLVTMKPFSIMKPMLHLCNWTFYYKNIFDQMIYVDYEFSIINLISCLNLENQVETTFDNVTVSCLNSENQVEIMNVY